MIQFKYIMLNYICISLHIKLITLIGGDLYMKLAEQIRKYRKNSGLTQEALAEKLNTTRQSVSKWEQGSLEPNIQMLNNLAELFGVSLDKLVNGKDELEDTGNKVYTSAPMNFWEFAAKKWWLIIIIILIISGTLSQIFG